MVTGGVRTAVPVVTRCDRIDDLASVLHEPRMRDTVAADRAQSRRGGESVERLDDSCI
jgi:hypothetical protein